MMHDDEWLQGEGATRRRVPGTGRLRAVTWVWTGIVLLTGSGVPAAHAFGDVTVKVSDGGSLKVTGDGEANAVDIVPAGNDAKTVVVSGSDATTVNGGIEPVVLGGVTKMDADLGGGDDSLIVMDFEFKKKVDIDLGKGSDELILDGIRAKKLVEVTGGGGADSIVVQDGVRFDGQFSVDAGKSADRVEIRGATCQQDVDISTAAGEDRVEVRSTDLHSGAKFELNTGDAEDEVQLVNNDFEDNIDIDLGSDDDDISLENCDFDDTVNVDGGGGRDEVDDQGDNSFNFNKRIRFRDFEDFD
jgi:hypothetical protein